MSMLIRIKNFFDELEKKEFRRYSMLFFGIIIGSIVLFFYMHNQKINRLQKELKKINRQRVQARGLLEKHTVVQQQKIEVDEILVQDKTFKIKEFFTRTVSEIGLNDKLSKEAEVSEPQDLENGYSEIKLDASFTKMNMKELCDLMYTIEKNRRIYTKELAITKALQSPTIDVTLVIATLQPKT